MKFTFKQFCQKVSTSFLLLSLFAFPNLLKAQVTIDDFSFDHPLVVAIYAGNTAYSVVDDPSTPSSIIGGERDLYVEVTSGSIVSAQIIDNQLNFSTNASTTGSFHLVWDGNDGDADIAALDHTGLGGQDLEGSTNTLAITVNSADVAGSVKLTIYTDASNYSSYNQAFPVISGASETYYLNYTDFVVQAGTGADFSNVGAVQLSGSGSSLDLILDIFQAVLPVEWSYFEVKNQNNVPLLEWGTEIEEENRGFQIQRQISGNTWEEVGFVSGQGTKFTPSKYTFSDHSNTTDLAYYRIKQIDYNGEFSFTPIKSFFKESTNDVNLDIYPNPIGQGQVLYIKKNIGMASIYDTSGRLRIRQDVTESQRSISVSELDRGYYIIEVVDSRGDRSFNKFLK